MIEKILPSGRAKMEVVRAIYEKPNINLSELIKEVGTSPNIVLDYVNLLIKHEVINEERVGGEKKAHMRLFAPNISSALGFIVFVSAEIDKEIAFIDKYREFMPFIKQLSELFSDSDVEFCLIYGSFARFAADKDSDLDILIAGKADKEMQKRISEIFVTLGRNYSIKIETLESFARNIKKDALHKNMLKNHVILWNEKKFVEFLDEMPKYWEKQ